jgi:hypothetical protein
MADRIEKQVRMIEDLLADKKKYAAKIDELVKEMSDQKIYAEK